MTENNNPTMMKAVLTRACGGFEQLDYCDVPIPKYSSDEVLIQVLAAGVNNTEINTRVGWYSSKVTSSSESQASASPDAEFSSIEDGGWSAPTPFPFIQGTDCCGRVVAVGKDVKESLKGARVLIRSCMRSQGWDSMDNVWMASDFDGAFAQFVKVKASEVFPVHCDWTDAELGSLPCAYATAENMVSRAGVGDGSHVLVPGASGGVGSAVVQLCKRRGAYVTAITSPEKMGQVGELGADQVLPRETELLTRLGSESVDVVVDNVGGPAFPSLLKLLKRGGVYTSSGAIAGPMVELDLRDFYLKDLRLIGCTAWDEDVFPNLISYVEKNEIRPLVAQTFPLEDIVLAQKTFMKKSHVGKIVLIPPNLSPEQQAAVESL